MYMLQTNFMNVFTFAGYVLYFQVLMNILNFKSDLPATYVWHMYNNLETIVSSNGCSPHYASPDIGSHKNNKIINHKQF
jgi:hypothetical protein